MTTNLKRKGSTESLGEPKPKRMAENQILEAINGIKNSVAAMEQQLKTVPTKTDMANIVSEIRGVKERVIRNTDRIDTLFDLRKDDGEILAKKVENIIDSKMAKIPAKAAAQSSGYFTNSDNERSFLRSRKSVRMWPVTMQMPGGLEGAVKEFLERNLSMPKNVIDGLTIEKNERQSQARRSKIQDEVLIMLETSQQRDTIQSYASNLAAVQGKAGIRLDVPNFLRGVFRMFVEHAAALHSQYGTVKRAVRFDDMKGSLFMDVKLEDTDCPTAQKKKILL